MRIDPPSPDDHPLAGVPDLARRTAMRRLAVLVGLPLAACAAPLRSDRPFDWEHRLTRNALVLLGEVHDNAEHHRLRLAVLQRAIARGWGPAIVMEQFDLDRQEVIDRARRERPGDAAYLVEQAGREGWEWRFYRPFVELALRRELPLIAANLPRSAARGLVEADYASVLGAQQAAALGLDSAVTAGWQGRQEQAVEAGHCGALPKRLLPGMARAQLARDASMAATLAAHAGRGAVLLAGNGHVREVGVPRWLERVHRLPSEQRLAVGFLEGEVPPVEAGEFDAVVVTPAAPRPDPCLAFRRSPTEVQP